jgi:hypothetical protein
VSCSKEEKTKGINSKHEIPAFAEAATRRQAKFETISNDQIIDVRNKQKFREFEFWKFGFVSDFDIRISNLKYAAIYLGSSNEHHRMHQTGDRGRSGED